MNTELWTKLNEFSTRTDVAAGIGGVFTGWLIGGDLVHQLTRDAVNYPNLIAGFPNASEYLMAFNPIMGGILAFTLISITSNIIKAHAMSSEDLMKIRIKDGTFRYKLPPFPDLGLPLTLGEVHGGDPNTPNYIEDPTWCTLPSKGMFQSIIVFGGTGTGKSESLLMPKTRDLISFRPLDPDYKMGGLFLEPKGDSIEKIKGYMKEAGRNDLLVIEPGGPNVWNPLHSPRLSAEAVASQLIAIYENMNPSTGGDVNSWVPEGVFKFFVHAIGIHRLVYDGYVTVTDVNTISFYTSATELVDDEQSGDKINPTIEYINRVYKSVWDAQSQTRSARDNQEFLVHYNWFIYDWAISDSKQKTTWASSAATITGIFTNPEIESTFCPKLADITFNGFDDVIDKGTFVALNTPGSIYGGPVATAIGIMLKLAFQRSALARGARHARDPSVNITRPLCFISDEYQCFATVSSSRCPEGDDAFFDRSRSSNTVNLVACQTKQSLEARLGEPKTRVILANILTKVCLRISDPGDQVWFADLFGKERQSFKSHSIGENSTGSFNVLTGSVRGKNTGVSQTSNYSSELTHIVQPSTLGSLKMYEAIVYASTGFEQLPPQRVYLKPTFVPNDLKHLYNCPKQVPYNELIISMKKEEARKAAKREI
jgi:hypothetical protein